MILNNLRKLLLKHEGLEVKPYKDSVGKLTIGIGRNLSDRGITREEAFYLFENDISTALIEIQKNCPWFATLNEARQDVIVSMVFNMGLPRFSGFKNMIRFLEVGNYKMASEEMLRSLWAGQVGERATELAIIMHDGKYPLEY